MTQQQKSGFVKVAIGIGIVPVLLWAYASGPDPRKTGAPGDSTCAEAGCHTGTAVNGGGGKVEIQFPGALTYTPGGGKVRLTIVVTDAAARVYGFQATARLASNARSAQAGRWDTAESNTFVMCEDGSTRPAAGCKSSTPLEFIEHSQPKGSGSFLVDWTPPATDQGDVTIYVAANAANGNGQNTGDKIYTANYTLKAATSTAPGPTISSGGVTDSFSFKGGIAGSTWISIFGQNLSTTTRTWDGSPEFDNKKLPTSLDGVSVTIGGKPAPVSFISPGLVNVLAPVDLGAGATQIVVKNANGQASLNMTATQQLPAFYAPFSLNSNGKLYVTAVNPLTGELVGTVGTDPRVKRAPKPGELVSLYATGFGDAKGTPATDTSFSGAFPLVTNPSITIGTSTLTNVPGFLVSPGLYLFNINVPDLADGDYPITATVNGITSSNIVNLSIKK